MIPGKSFLLLVSCVLFLGIFVTPVFAQNITPTPIQSGPTPAAGGSTQGVEGAATLGVATMVSVKDPNVKDGSILSSTDKGAVLSTTPYDSQVIGVVSRDAGI